MPRRPLKIKQSEIARLFRAADKAGFGLIIEVRPDGTMVFIQSNKPSAPAAPTPDYIKPKTLF